MALSDICLYAFIGQNKGQNRWMLALFLIIQLASFKSFQTPALCNQYVESLTRDFFSRRIFAASLSSCYNEGQESGICSL